MRALVLAVLVGCGGHGSGGGTNDVGNTCETNADCDTGICWDFAEHDPLCGGKVCSIACVTDPECVTAAMQHGASLPDNAQCGTDQQCDLVGTGLGQFVCARQ